MTSSGYRSPQSRTVLWVGAIFITVLVGAGLIWVGFSMGRKGPNEGEQASQPPPTLQAAVSPSPVVMVPTATPVPLLPTATPLPEATPVPPSATAAPAQAMVVVGEGGVNVRSGPGTNFGKLGFLDAAAEAAVTGSYDDWWQIVYEGGSAWVYGELVTASNVDAVPEVPPPASPVPPTAAPAQPTAVPAEPTAAPPPANTRGLVVHSYGVDGAPGPFAAGQQITFRFDVQNTSDAVVKYDALGTWVEGTDIFQKSYARHSSGDDPLVINPAGTDWSRIKHDDKLSIPNPGTYNLYLAIHFVDNGNITAALLAGPVTITVQ